MGWRKTPFKTGYRYRVRKDFTLRFLSEQSFKAGEELVYRSDCYSHYDGFSGFTFQEVGKDSFRTIEIADEDADPNWSELFEEIQSEEKSVL